MRRPEQSEKHVPQATLRYRRPQNKDFGRGLSDAIYLITRKRGVAIGVLQDEIAHDLKVRGGSKTVDAWKGGQVPRLPTLKTLIMWLRRNDGLDDAGAQALYAAAAVLPVVQIGTGSLPVLMGNGSTQTALGQLLIGRDVELKRILDRLADPTGPQVIGIDGLGGIGKSALAQAVASSARQFNMFDFVETFSAQRTQIAPVGAGLTFRALMFELAAVLQLNPPESFDLSVLTVRVRAALADRRSLLILDNLETAAEPQAELIRRLQSALGNVRIVATSRLRLEGDCFRVPLIGLKDSDANTFFDREAEIRNLPHARNLSETAVRQIVRVCGGVPLAMRLVVGQTAYLPLETVLAHLREVKPLRVTRQKDEYIGLYRGIYWSSWRALGRVDRALLISMEVFAMEAGGDLAAIQSVSGLTRAALLRGVDSLWRMSLIEMLTGFEQVDQERRFGLHSLTQHFVASDIVQMRRPI
jgi:NB-ARC domain